MASKNGRASRTASISSGQPITIPSSALTDCWRTLLPGDVHLGVSKEIALTLRNFGIDPDPVIRAAGLDPLLFDNGTSAVSFAALDRLYTMCVARTGCAHFGLLVGQQASIPSLGLVGRLMQHSHTVGEAVRALVSNLSVQDRAVVPSLTISDGTVLLTFATYQAGSRSVDQILDAALGAAVNVLRTLCGPHWNPIEVLVPRGSASDAEPYRRHFRAPARFDQESATMVFPARDLDREVAGADPLLRVMLEERIQQIKGTQDADLADDVRRLLRARLTSNRCLADDTAELLAMHRRTLGRHLKRSGMGYRTITNDIRFEIARQLLQDTQVSLSQIAAALGYSEASVFTRAFRRWSGQTPTAWRSHSDTDESSTL